MAYGLAKAVDDYVILTQANDTVHTLLTSSGLESYIESRYSGKIQCWIARH